jgi:hypothetical protein
MIDSTIFTQDQRDYVMECRLNNARYVDSKGASWAVYLEDLHGVPVVPEGTTKVVITLGSALFGISKN